MGFVVAYSCIHEEEVEEAAEGAVVVVHRYRALDLTVYAGAPSHCIQKEDVDCCL